MYEQFVSKKVYATLIGQVIESNRLKIDQPTAPIGSSDVMVIEDFLVDLQEFLLAAHTDSFDATELILLLTNFEALGLGQIHIGIQVPAYVVRLDLTDLGKSIVQQLCDLEEAEFEYDEEQACYIRVSFLEDIVNGGSIEDFDEDEEEEEEEEEEEVTFIEALFEANAKNKN